MNEERKSKFISDSNTDQSNREWIAAMFRFIAAAEDEFGKDLAEMTAEETSRALASSSVVSFMTLTTRIPLVIRYKKWCAENGFKSVQVSQNEIHVDLSASIRESMVCSPKMLSDVIRKAFQINNENSSKYVYRAYLWLGFSGMYAEDAVRVCEEDIDFRQRTVFFGNRWYKFPEEALEDIRAAGRITEFVRPDDNGNIKTFPRTDGRQILRGRKLKKVLDDKRYIRATLNSAVTSNMTQAGYSGLSFNRVRKSGIFYEALCREVRGIPVNFYEVGHDDYIHTGKKETAGQTKQKILRRIILNYENDYRAWKLAFAETIKQDFGIDSIPDLLQK